MNGGIPMVKSLKGQFIEQIICIRFKWKEMQQTHNPEDT